MPSSYSLGEHYEAFAKKLVASGRYASVSEVLRDGMRLMEEREALRDWKLNELKKAIQEGIDSGFEDYEGSDDLKAEGRKVLAERQKNHAAQASSLQSRPNRSINYLALHSRPKFVGCR